ncbi:uncharacterized protein PADG_00939 [Paracoccidioides brasiliensis Pb18]|uniref:Uncharacterized protein n=1 Tax=Paracoccidioides brasiliensis (strain Pb18) TaxID=502780 RepID=C1FYR3_PARBD|nr:uncharacterized protein PADG_00939 [Paracoccidioides brasiliensis Pb18]EEH44650.2 hypothetical protein PADG_00939 [Paracoccidioides brasiliensis Pb18]
MAGNKRDSLETTWASAINRQRSMMAEHRQKLTSNSHFYYSPELYNIVPYNRGRWTRERPTLETVSATCVSNNAASFIEPPKLMLSRDTGDALMPLFENSMTDRENVAK